MKKVSQREVKSACMILCAYCIELKAQSIKVDEEFKDFFFDIEFKINKVTNLKTKEDLILETSEKFEEIIKPEILKEEKIMEGKFKEN